MYLGADVTGTRLNRIYNVQDEIKNNIIKKLLVEKDGSIKLIARAIAVRGTYNPKLQITIAPKKRMIVKLYRRVEY